MNSDKKLVIVLVRHGETIYNIEKRLQSPKDALTERGKEQMQALANTLGQYTFTRCITSDETRALESAEILRDAVQKTFEVKNLIREKSSGDFSDKLVSEVDWSTVHGTFLDKKMPNGESVLDVVRRALEFLKILNNFEQGETVLVVSHGTFIRVLLALMFNQSIEDYLLHHEYPNASESVLSRTPDGKWHLEKSALERKG